MTKSKTPPAARAFVHASCHPNPGGTMRFSVIVFDPTTNPPTVLSSESQEWNPEELESFERTIHTVSMFAFEVALLRLKDAGFAGQVVEVLSSNKYVVNKAFDDRPPPTPHLVPLFRDIQSLRAEFKKTRLTFIPAADNPARERLGA